MCDAVVIAVPHYDHPGLVIEAFEKYYDGNINDVPVYNTIGMEDPWYYRNKTQLPTRHDGEKVVVGIYAQDTNKLVYDMFNYQIKSMRPTYGAINQKLREQSNLDVIMWDIDTRDWKYKDSKKIANIAINEASDSKIILMHDTKSRTLEAVKILVPELIKQGYQFVTIQELKEIKAIRQQESYE